MGDYRRDIVWKANKFTFEVDLEEFLSHCPNMTGEDDMRDLCEKKKCPMYAEYCVSIEPAEDSVNG